MRFRFVVVLTYISEATSFTLFFSDTFVFSRNIELYDCIYTNLYQGASAYIIIGYFSFFRVLKVVFHSAAFVLSVFALIYASRHGIPKNHAGKYHRPNTELLGAPFNE